MKKVEVVFYQAGENNGTWSPKCFLENFTGDLAEKTTRLISHDFWQPIEVDMFKVVVVPMPEFFTEEVYLRHSIDLRFARAYGMPENISEVEFYNFIRLDGRYQHFLCWLLKGNTKNSFKLSIREQVKAWLSTERPAHNMPLTQRQYEAVTKFYPSYEYKQISNHVYNNYHLV